MLKLETTGRLPRGEPRISSKWDFPSKTPAEPRCRDWSNSLAIFDLAFGTVCQLKAVKLASSGGSVAFQHGPCNCNFGLATAREASTSTITEAHPLRPRLRWLGKFRHHVATSGSVSSRTISGSSARRMAINILEAGCGRRRFLKDVGYGLFIYDVSADHMVKCDEPRITNFFALPTAADGQLNVNLDGPSI